MSQNRATIISRIIDQRLPRAKKIADEDKKLRTLKSVLISLKRYRQNLLTQVDDSNVCNRLQAIEFESLIDGIDSELNALEKLKPRFCRNTLKIGVVGRARQGKSRLLQSITSLTAAEIPDGDRQHCTGVRSTIYHKPQTETYAEVFFHSKQSFLDEVIAPYFEKLTFLGTKPITIEDFASKNLPLLPTEIRHNAENGAMYEHLKRYHENLSEYSQLFEASSPRKISKSEIREYVAQDNLAGEREYFNYMAIREVNIYCNFPNADVGKIALIDMPGLGDTGIGDEKRLIKTLGRDIDIALFVKKPDPNGDYWKDVDVKMYDVAQNALFDLPIENWSFLVLNHINGEKSNYRICQDLSVDTSKQHMSFFDSVIADCSNFEEANQKVLDRILDYLTTNIIKLDDKYELTAQQRRRELQTRIVTELDKGSNIFSNLEDEGIESLFEDLVDDFWEEITHKLNDLLLELIEERDTQDDHFRSQIQYVFEKCEKDTGIPSIDEIKREGVKLGSIPTAYFNYLDKIRTRLSKHFLSLDDGLKHSIEVSKSRVTNVLTEQGKLGRLTDVRGSKFLEVVHEIIPENLSNLKLGFQIISEFNLSYRGLIQHRIRGKLDSLTPNLATPLPQNPSEEMALEFLEELHAEAIYECREALQSFSSEPSQASFALIEEFIDQILRAEKVKREWKKFLRKVRGKIWIEEFNPIIEYNNIREKWTSLLEEAIDTCKALDTKI